MDECKKKAIVLDHVIERLSRKSETIGDILKVYLPEEQRIAMNLNKTFIDSLLEEIKELSK